MIYSLVTRHFIACPECEGFMNFADWWEDLDSDTCGFRCPDCLHTLTLIDTEEIAKVE